MHLARGQRLVHASGKSIQTPLLVPSFSSKGFEFFKVVTDDTGGEVWVSEAGQALEFAAPHLSGGILLSAYDIFHGHLGDISTYLSIPEIAFIDSGGYECTPNYDVSELYAHPYEPKDWSLAAFAATLGSIPIDAPNLIAVVSYDRDAVGSSLETQVQAARTLFASWPGFIHVVLLKPTKPKQKYLPIDEIRAAAVSLREFHVIGVTEKELGNSILRRMKSIAQMRRELDEVGISAPIHVFGALDPVLTPLYFLAGAEIFDGLSWLRYAFYDGLAIYVQNFGVLELGIQRRMDQIRAQVLINNLNYLDRLRIQMQTFLQTHDPEVFTGHASTRFQGWYNDLLGELRGGG